MKSNNIRYILLSIAPFSTESCSLNVLPNHVYLCIAISWNIYTWLVILRSS